MEPDAGSPVRPEIASSSSLPEAYHRAPTLAAREGSDGCAVKVWGPTRQKKGMFLLTGYGITLAILGALGCLHVTGLNLLFGLTILLAGIGIFAVAWDFARHPVYLSTDDTGIGITHSKGSRVLNWSDIQGLKDNDYYLVLDVPDHRTYTQTIELGGYPRTVRRELRNLIIRHCGLVPHFYHKSYYLPNALAKKDLWLPRRGPVLKRGRPNDHRTKR